MRGAFGLVITVKSPDFPGEDLFIMEWRCRNYRESTFSTWIAELRSANDTSDLTFIIASFWTKLLVGSCNVEELIKQLEDGGFRLQVMVLLDSNSIYTAFEVGDKKIGRLPRRVKHAGVRDVVIARF